ncbi:hypothetical protein ACQQ6W_16240 [Lysinibacillus fusiformis]
MTKFIEQRVDELENQVAKLELIIRELRGKKSIESSTILEDIIEFEGQQYRKVDREAKVGDVVIFNSKIYPHNAEPNKPYIVNRQIAYGVGHHDGETICNVKFAIYDHGRTPENVAVYELIEPKPLTPNQQRAAVIEKAKVFVKNIVGEYDTFRTTIGKYKDQCVRPIFHVNEKKRAITVLIYGAFGKELIFKGLAKCYPGEVFNEHIGKAIALGRALGLDVSEFEQAVQPTEFTKGQIVVGGSTYREPREVTKVTHDDYVYRKPIGGNDFDDSWCNAKYLTIINDTNATYEVSSNE